MKVFTKALILSFLVAFNSACHHEMCCAINDVGVDVLVKDKNGNNLLDATTAGHYDADAIKLFSIENGVRTEIAKLANSSPFSIIKGDNNATMLRLFPTLGTGKGEVTRTNAIQWRTNDEDVIESTISSDKNSNHCSKVKCNGATKYDSHDSATRRVVEIIKP